MDNAITTARRSTSVSGGCYLLHNVRASNRARTVCGRLCATVNHSYDATPREELCKACVSNSVRHAPVVQP